MRCIVILAVAALGTGTALAQTPSATADTSAKLPAKVKKVCRATQATGSIMKRRICRTTEEWAAIDAANADNVDRFRESRPNGLGANPS